MLAKAKKPKWERKAEERPGALLEAALDVFTRQGYRAARLESVAEAAGVSKGTIYRYFENKEDLLKRALQDKVDVKIAHAEAALQEIRGGADVKLRYILDRYWKRAMEPDWGRFHRLMFGEIASEQPLLFRFWIEKGTVRAWKLIEDIIRAGQAEGAFRKDADAQGIAQFALSGLTHQAYLKMHLGQRGSGVCPPDRIFASSFDLLITGLKPKTPAGKNHD